MNAYVLSAAVGLLVGVIYGAFNVRSPAPPVIALVGLLGILAGEQIPGLVRQWMQREPAEKPLATAADRPTAVTPEARDA